MSAGFRWLVILFSLAGASSVSAQGISTWTFEWNASSVVLIFPQPISIEGVRVPVVEESLWGPGRHGKIAALKTDNKVGVAVTGFPEQVLHGVISDPFTRRLEVFPVFTEPAPPANDGLNGVVSWHAIPQEITASNSDAVISRQDGSVAEHQLWEVLGSPAEQRRLEIALKRCLTEEVDWQRRRGCFSCHRLLPLGLAVQEAWKKRIYVPSDVLRELIQNLVDWQNSDGSWFFPREPRYGRVTPTLAAVAVLGWWEELSPADGSQTQLRGLTFLSGRQNSDGSLDYDFSFPPLFYGRTSAGWLFLNGLAFGRREANQNGREYSSRLEASQERLRAWFLRSDEHAWRKSLFTLLSRSLIPGLQTELCRYFSDRLQEELKIIGMVAESAIGTLANLALQQEGKPLLPKQTQLSDPMGDSLTFWGLVDGILREPSLP